MWRGYTARALASDMIEVLLLEHEELSDSGEDEEEYEDEEEEEGDDSEK